MRGLQRFKDVLRTAWLVAKRGGLSHDMRNKLVKLLAVNMFHWESEVLRQERDAMLCSSADLYWDGRLRHLRSRILGAIILQVEECDPLPFPRQPEDDFLLLTRMRARKKFFSLQTWFWIRLRE